MPCDCSDDIFAIGTNRPFANQADVTKALRALAGCCMGSIANGTDPITDAAAALLEGFPDGLTSTCGCDILYLEKPNGTLYASHDEGNEWFILFNGGQVYGVLLDDQDPNDGAGSFVSVPYCPSDAAPSFAYDSIGNVWASVDRGVTWFVVKQRLWWANINGSTSLPVCNDGTLTTMIGYVVNHGETGIYNLLTGEVTIPIDGLYEVYHRIEFGAGELAAGTLIQSHLAVGGTALRESQNFKAAHSNASYPVSCEGRQDVLLSEGDILTHEVRIVGSGNETPEYGTIQIRLKERL